MRLNGRENQTRRIDSLLDAARAGKSGVLLLRGEPGIGKTALLRYATERAHGMTVLQAQGLEAETELAFCALADVFRRVTDRLDAIPEPQSAALAGALGLGPPVPGDRFLVCASTLSLLAAAADDRPVLAVVDDLQRIDAASREALLFAARRLDGEHVIMLIAGRDSDTAIDSSGVDELTLSGLDRDAAAELLEGRLGHRIPPHLLDGLMEATGGNPLGLFELASSFSETPGGSGQGSRRNLPAATTVERAFLRRIGGLPAPTRYGLVVLAADSGVRPIVLEACALLGLPDGCLQAAEDAGVIRVEGDRITFTHPLLRAAVYRAAPELTRERVHRTLRRTSRVADARTYLRSALQTFDRLGARPWGNRARSELATTGETTRPEPRNDLSELTPQELQMALIVGQGATNKEASAALFISPKTVEAHLHRIYVKLGIRSRTELAGLLARAHMLGD